MPELDETLIAQPRELGPKGREVLEGRLVVRPDGRYVDIDGTGALWGPSIGGADFPAGATVLVAITQEGRPWLLASDAPEPPSINTGTWNWTADLAATANGFVGINAATWDAATEIHLSKYDAVGADGSNVLALITVDDGIYLQQTTDSTRWGRYTVTAPSVDHGSWLSYAVTFVNGSGAVPPEGPPGNRTRTRVSFLH